MTTILCLIGGFVVAFLLPDPRKNTYDWTTKGDVPIGFLLRRAGLRFDRD